MQSRAVRTNGHTELEGQVARLFEAVFSQRPVLKTLIEKHGNETLHTYASNYAKETIYPEDRRNQIISIIECEVERLFGTHTANRVREQLAHEYLVNTADHVGPVTHSWFVSTSALIGTSLSNASSSIITLACSNVSLNNISFPRGVLFHTAKGQHMAEQRLSFLPSDSHAASVYGFRPYTTDEIKKVKKLLREKVRAGDVTDIVAAKLTLLIDEVYGTDTALSQSSYADQISITNKVLWERMFQDEHVPELLYIEQEKIVAVALTQHHMDSQSVISKILFDPKYTTCALEHFDAVPSCYSLTEHKGTFLFWGVSDQNNYRVSLWYHEGTLRSADGTVTIPLTPQAITTAIREKKIVPSLLLTFMLLSFHYGLNCIGGFNQINYVTAMKNAYLKFLSEMHEDQERILVASTTTDNTNDVTLGYIGDGVGLTPATGIDFYLYGLGTTWKQLDADVNTFTLADALLPGMPTFYRCTRQAAECDPQLSDITSSNITKQLAIDQKLKPTISV